MKGERSVFLKAVATLAAAFISLISADAQNWNTDSNGNWNTQGNWSGNSVPVSGSTATLGNVTTATRSVSINGSQSVGTLNITSPFGYNVDGSGTLTLSGGTGITLASGAGASTISSNLNVQSSRNIINDSANALTISGDVNFNYNNHGNLVVGGSGNTTMSGTFTNQGVLEKQGTGVLTVTQSSSGWSGNWIVSAGVLNFGTSSAAGSTTHSNVVASGATLALSAGITLTEGNITVSGTGAAGQGGAIVNSGTNTINSTVALGGNTTFNSTSGTLTFSGGNGVTKGTNSLTLDGAGAMVFSNVINGAGDLTSTGSGNRTFNGNVQDSANININGSGTNSFTGNVQNFTNLNISGSGTTSFSNTVQSFTAINLTGSGNTTFSGPIGGGGTLNVGTTGGATVTLSGGSSNGISGLATVSNGELILSKSSGATALSGNVQVGDGIGAAGSAIVRSTAAEQINNNSTVYVKSDGSFQTGGYTETIRQLDMTGGTVTTGATGKIAITDNAVNAIQGHSGGGTATINGNVEIAGYSRTIDTGGGDMVINGVLTAGTELTKSGVGKLTLSGSSANSWGSGAQGKTIISGGTLTLAKTAGINAITSTEIVVQAGSVLELGASNQIADTTKLTLSGGDFSTGATVGYAETLGQLSVTANSTIHLGSGSATVNFASSNSLTWSGSLTIYGWTGTSSGGTSDRIFFGVSGLSATQLSQITFAGFTGGAMLLNTGELVTTGTSVVPEANSLSLLLIGALLLFLRERRRRLQTA